jgi:RHS repeat-associated protein
MRRSRVANSFAAAVLLVPLFGSAAQAAAGATRFATPAVDLGSAGSDPGAAPVRTVKLSDAAGKNFTPTAATWPGAASATVELTAPTRSSAAVAGSKVAAGASGAAVSAAGTPVSVRAVADSTGAYLGPASIGVRVLDHAAAVKADVSGVVFAVTANGGGRGKVQVALDDAAFAQGYGGNYASRLRLVELPACALTTPQVTACQAETPLASTNDVTAHSLSAQITLGQAVSSSPKAAAASATSAASSALVLAATSSPSSGDGGGPGGQYGATSLKPSGSWSAGGSSGSFDYSYPITVPPAASDLVPTVGLSYDSGSVDGQTAATQAQADWLGDGWSTPENYIEQSFVSCSDDPEGSAAPQSTGDECYDGNVLTISLNGMTTSLVRDDTTGTWKLEDDNGSVVSLVTGSSTGTNVYDNEYWKVTERDGTSYYFGLNELPGWTSGQPQTDSVQSEPVYSAHSGDPCYNATWSSSWCTMAYRWNLDYVTDAHGNAMAYFYDQGANAYAQNGNTSKATAYVRDAYLDHIDYGFTNGNAYGTIPDKIQFSTGDRCLAASSSCDPLSSSTASNWPDVPFDLVCTTGAACQVTGPSFFSTVRLTGITAEQYNGSGYNTVDSYTFTQTMPATGDDTSPTLWLSSIGHTGEDTSAGGSAVTLPNVTFTGVQEANRVDTTTDGLPPLYRWRIKTITTETGAVISVNYELVNPCTAPVTLNPATNTSSCFPVYWTPQGGTAPLLDWFNKYVVHSVSTQDPTGGSPGLYTSYLYNGGAAWHYDDNEVVQSKYRTYGQYRGYGDVQTFTGQGSDPITESETTYYRGMSDDNDSTAVTLTDSQGGTHADTDQLAGDALETTDYFYSGGPVADSSINSYWVSAPTASRSRSGLPALTANATGQVETWARQAITDSSPTTWRTTETDTAYDATTTDADFGLPVMTYEHGDLAVSGDNQTRCTVTTYAPANAAKNIVGLPAEVEVDADPCGGSNPNGASAPTSAEINALTAPTTVSRPADVVSDTRTFYDLQPLGSTTRPSTTPAWPESAPTYGDESETQAATGYTGGAFTYQASTESTFDTYGRVLDTWDALGRETQTAYTMTNGLTTGQTSTNPLGQVTTSVIDPERAIVTSSTDPNGIVTQNHADGLGRTIAVWLDSRPTTAAANYVYTYSISNTEPSVTTPQTLNNESGYATSETFYDALLRPRQTQSPTPQGGRLLTDTFYDSHGWVVKTDSNYWDTSSTPDTTMAPVVPDDKEYQQTLTSYDGLGRAVEVQSLDNTADPVVDQITYTEYTGDETITVPPTGGVAQYTVTDAMGRTTALDQYTAAPTVTTGTAGGFTTVSVTGGTTQATDYLYDNIGDQTDVKDVTSGEDWNTSYNMLGEAIAKNDPDAGASTMSYDAGGELTQTTDALGKTISYTYDALGRKTGEYDAPVASQSTSNELASWVYDNSNDAVSGMADAIGQLTTETAYSGGSAYTVQQKGFNAFGESTGETITIPSSAGAFSSTDSFAYSYGYGATTGIPTSTTYPAAGNLPAETVGTGYTAADEIDVPSTLSSLSGGYVHNVTYTDLGQIGQEELGNTTYNAYLTNTYNLHTGALTDQQVANTAVSATPIDQTSYTYDQAGNPTSQTETRQGTASETQCFQYDALDRLTQAWTGTAECATPTASNEASTVTDGISGGEYWTSWEYDSLGQWLSQDQHSLTSGTADTTTTYSYGGSASGCTTASTGTNTLTSTTTTGPSGTSSNTYCSDADGNTTQRDTTANGQQSLTWNDLGQLSAVTTASAGSSYTYDADGNLLVENDPGTSILYLPGQQIALNTSTGVTSGTRFYQLPGGGQVVRTGPGTDYVFELSDLHGTSLLELDFTLTTPTWRQQTPFGASRGATVTWSDNLGFLNQPQDSGTGLTDIGARWYDPSLGRFESLDPVLEAGSPQQLNGYTYAADNPVTGSDPTGLTMMTYGRGGSCDASCQQQYGIAPSDGSAADSTTPSDAQQQAAQEEQQAKAQLAAAEARQREIEAAIAALKAYIAEQQHILYLEATQDRVGSSNCSGTMLRLGACPGEEAAIGDGAATYCSGSAGWGCLITGLSAIIPIGEIADALGVSAAVLGAGSKVLDAIAPGLSDAIANGLAGARDLVGALGGKASQLVSKIMGDEATVSADSALEGCLNSFAGTTLVLMADGSSKPIDQIKVGDKIANNQPGADPGTKNQSHTVTYIHVTYTDTDFTNVTIATPNGPATITGTAHHPYWDATTHTWTDADQLHPGDHVETTDSNPATVLATRSYTSHTIITYNLTVDSLHTYYVLAGDMPVLVHNSECFSAEAQEIAQHALARSQDGSVDSVDHVIPGVKATESGYAAYADSVMDRPGVEMGYRSSDDSTAYWDDEKNVIIIVSTNGEGTMFMPRGGYSYFTDNFTSIGKVG